MSFYWLDILLDVLLLVRYFARSPVFFFIVGGIYTVIRSKAAVTVDEIGSNYYLFGPYNESSVQTEVEVMEPESAVVSAVIQSMRDRGMKVCAYQHMMTHFILH